MNSQNSDSASSGQRKLRLGCFSQLLIALVLLVALAGLAVLTWTVTASQRLESVLKDMRAAGYATTIGELESKLGPAPESNSGPLWIEAGEALLADNAPDTKNLPFIGEQWDSEVPRVGEPFPALESCKAYLARHGKELALIRRAASNPAPPRYRDALVQSPSTFVDRRYVNGHRQIQRVLRMTALVQAHEQDFDRLVSTLVEQLRVGKSLQDEPTLMGQFIACACSQMALEDIKTYVEQCEFTDEQLSRLQTGIQESQPFLQMRRGLEGELAHGLTLIDAHTKPIPRNDDKRFLAEQVFKLLMATESKNWAEIRARVDEIEQQRAAIESSPIQIARFALASSSLDAYSRLTNAMARLQSHLSVTNAKIAAKRFQIQNGELPTDWQELIPQFLSQVPIDPYSSNGESMILSTDSGRTLVYGRGFNTLDDGGSVEPDDNGLPLDIVVELAK